MWPNRKCPTNDTCICHTCRPCAATATAIAIAAHGSATANSEQREQPTREQRVAVAVGELAS
jgi:hypothetical protein